MPSIPSSSKPAWRAGVARRKISPPNGVELAGLGYYLNRVWQRLRDDLNATALVISDGEGKSVALAVVDLMYNDAAFTAEIRRRVSARTDIPADAICVNCSHSHNAPTAGLIRGGGERDEAYLSWAATQVADAIVDAAKSRQPAQLKVGHGELPHMTFNRVRFDGPVDTRVGVLRVDTSSGAPLAVVVNFHSHCIAHMETDLFAVSRDWPGEVVDQLEAALPGVTALYLQGVAGDVNFQREFNGTERRFEPARALTKVALETFLEAHDVERPGIACVKQNIVLPSRRWTHEEVRRDREEGLYRLKTGDIAGWTEGVARYCVNQPERLPLRYDGDEKKAALAVAQFAVEWTDEILPILDTTPETLLAEAQAIRIGDVWLAANPAELFTSLGLSIRASWPHDDLFLLGYSNGSIGYLPDADAFAHPNYATVQSPKFTGQFPFTPESGAALVAGTLEALTSVARLQD